VSCASRASVNLSEITAMAGAPSALHILPAVKGYCRRSWLTAHATGLQAEPMRGEMGHSADNLCSLYPILRTLFGWFPRTTMPALPLSVNHLPGGVLILPVVAAFRQWRPPRTVVIGSDIHLALLLPAADSQSRGDRPAGARLDRCPCAEAPAPVAQAARLRKRVYWGSNSSFTVPTGPLRCLVTITSVMPRSGVSGL
jgi:hypothetical protein